MRYGELEISNFDPQSIELWENKHERFYTINITLPEFSCLCPRSGYPDYASVFVSYAPARFVVELKALKLYINSFRNRYISHEDSINEIYALLWDKLAPKKLLVRADFNPRGNVHTIIEINSEEQR